MGMLINITFNVQRQPEERMPFRTEYRSYKEWGHREDRIGSYSHAKRFYGQERTERLKRNDLSDSISLTTRAMPTRKIQFTKRHGNHKIPNQPHHQNENIQSSRRITSPHGWIIN